MGGEAVTVPEIIMFRSKRLEVTLAGGRAAGVTLLGRRALGGGGRYIVWASSST